MTLILSNDDVERLLPMQLCISALEEGYRDLAAGEAVTRARSDCLVPTKRPDAVYGLKTTDGVVPRAGVAGFASILISLPGLPRKARIGELKFLQRPTVAMWGWYCYFPLKTGSSWLSFLMA